jgi:hypothetical protein
MPKEEIKLSQYAKEQNLPYKKVWNLYKAGGLPVKTKVSESGRVSIVREAKASVNLDANLGQLAPPLGTGEGKQEIYASRRNKAATSSPTDELFHIRDGISPFATFSHERYGSVVNMSEIFHLTQLAYYNFAIIKNTIDLMTEFSTNKIFLRGGNSKSQKFIYNWMNSINLLDFQDKFFRECYRSCNVFCYKVEGEIDPKNIGELNTTFGSKLDGKTKLPIKYIILNPADINIQGGALFSDSGYLKLLNPYEIARLRAGKSPGDKAILNSFDAKIQQEIKSGSSSILIPLDPDLVTAIFYKKQDYEALAVPMIYPVLKDINWKAEMKRIDMAVSRVMQNVVLLIKMGYESKSGKYMVDREAMAAMRQLFESESVGKTLVSDFSTEVEFKIPTIGDFLDPKKYEIVNTDIKEGLNTILGGTDSKFANQYIQVQLFIQRLQQTREIFLTKFLIPEIRTICEIMNFKSAPTPFFQDIDLKDSSEFNRILAQLYQYGLLTPSEALTGFETGRLPTGDESLESQKLFKESKDSGYYEPITGGSQTQLKLADKTSKTQMKTIEMQQEHDSKMKTKELKHKAENPEPIQPQIHINAPGIKKPVGKPTGPAGKNSKTRKSSPMRASEEYSLSSVKNNIILAAELKDEIELLFLKKHKIKELSPEQDTIVQDIRSIVIANENPEDWLGKAAEYLENPINWNYDKINEIDNIAVNHSLDPFLSSILYASKKVDE